MPLIQGQMDEEGEELQTKLLPEATGLSLQRQVEAEEEEETIQTKAYSTQTGDAAPDLESSLEAVRSGGEPLPKAIRAFFEPRFGHDFSHVRLHTDSRADESARAINALAYTAGADVFFQSGQYNPSAHEGRRLLAHELAHVVQKGGKNCIRRSVVENRRKQIVETSLSLTEEHYLMGAGGQIPDKGGGVNDRNVVLNPGNHGASIDVYYGGEKGTIAYLCGGRFSKVTSLPEGDPKNKDHQSTPQDYKWNRGGVYGEACEGKRHFDCGGFVSYCYHQACPKVTYPGPADNLMSTQYGWQDVKREDVQGGDVAYRTGHAGLCIDNTQVMSALGRKWGVEKESKNNYTQFGRLKCLIDENKPKEPGKKSQER